MGWVRNREESAWIEKCVRWGGTEIERRGYEDRNGYGWDGSKIDREKRI